jgi:integrase
LKNCPPQHKPYIYTAIFTGMRASELRGLTWDQVNFDRSLIRVRQRADRWNNLGDPKSAAGSRDIPMAPMVSDLLKVWKRLDTTGGKGFVFANGAGNVESHSNIYNRVFKPLMVDCGLVDEDGKAVFTMHAFRHATASLLIEQGWDRRRFSASWDTRRSP